MTTHSPAKIQLIAQIKGKSRSAKTFELAKGMGDAGQAVRIQAETGTVYELRDVAILKALLLLMALLCGMQMGESRVQKAWDAEKQKIALAQARQEQHVADVRQTQSQITQEISNEYAKRSKLLADRQPDSRAGGVCNVPATGGRDLPTVTEAPARAASARSDPLSAPSGYAGEVSCEQLRRDAAQTTLMLVEIQRWVEAMQATYWVGKPPE